MTESWATIAGKKFSEDNRRERALIQRKVKAFHKIENDAKKSFIIVLHTAQVISYEGSPWKPTLLEAIESDATPEINRTRKGPTQARSVDQTQKQLQDL